MYSLRQCLKHREPSEPISVYTVPREPKFQEDHRQMASLLLERMTAGAALDCFKRKWLSLRVVVIDEPCHSEETVEIYILE
jgi:hypothetical protein